MWQPPERIKHRLPAVARPTADEAPRARLFQSLAIGPRRARTRTWRPAQRRGYCCCALPAMPPPWAP